MYQGETLTLTSYAEAVHFLYSLGNEVKAAKLGLDRMSVLLEALASPHRTGNFIHVAGTNGKGSVCAMVESGLRAAGKRTGLYTSPHLEEPTERIRIGGEPVSREEFSAAFVRVHEAAEQLIASGGLEAHPTYFETVTAMAFLVFRQREVDVAVIEVGLGGRLDATNVVLPKLAVITPIDFDHEQFLGRSLEAIAGEKAGILKRGVPAVFARQRPEAEKVLEETASALGILPVRTAEWSICDLVLTPVGSRFRVTGRIDVQVECPLAGEHQVANAMTAVAALDAFGIPVDAIREGIRATEWPGRLEHIPGKPEYILDGAHNPAGARTLSDYIRRFYVKRKVWLVYGAMRDKAIEEVAAVLFPLTQEVIATAPPQARAVRPETIRELTDHPHLRTTETLEEALAMIRREAGPEDAVFLSGSLFLVAQARKLLLF